MTSCNHTFAWHSVIPPSHCPVCGRCLGCGQGAYPAPMPIYPQPPRYPMPWWHGPWHTSPNTWMTTTTNTG